MSPQEHYDALVAYLKVKVEVKDWHGVSDAANDIRELLVAHPELENSIGDRLKG